MFYFVAMRIDRLSRLALQVLEDAAARAHCGDVKRTWGHRLALELLVQRGFAERWQAAQFWENLAFQSTFHQFDSGATYIQASTLTSSVIAWAYSMGVEPIAPVRMGRLARRYAPDLEFDCGTQQLPCMCNRYTPGDRQLIKNLFGARQLREFNEGPPIVHPRDPGWVVRLVDGERVLEQMTWGFPVHLRGKAGQPLKPKAVNNARFDKLKGFWKQWALFPEKRCLIPAAAYAEAVGPAGAMMTTWLSVKDSPVFAWAGLWHDSDEWGSCYTGVMTENAPELASIHDRSPVILNPKDWDTWLSEPLEELFRFNTPMPAGRMRIQATDVYWKTGGAVLPPPVAESKF